WDLAQYTLRGNSCDAASLGLLGFVTGCRRGFVPDPVEHNRPVEWLRDLFGNPFRPVSLTPAWLTPTVLKLAQVAYDNRLLPSGHLDDTRLAVLADALEEAGCSNADILSHLRGPGPHVRGCWVVDVVTG